MLIPAPPLYPRKRKPRVPAPVPTPPVAPGPVLVAAELESAVWVQLTFDRPVDASGADTSQVIVDDNGTRWRGLDAAVVLGPTVVRIELLEVGPWPGTGATLTVSAANGIVAVEDDVAWAGVTDVALPFGE